MGCGQKKVVNEKENYTLNEWKRTCRQHPAAAAECRQNKRKRVEKQDQRRRKKKVAQRKTITRKEMPWQLLVKRNMFIKGSRMENTFHPATLRNRLGASRVPPITQSKRVKRAGKLAAGFGESARRKIHFEGASWNFIYNLFWAFIPVLRWLPVTHNLFSILKSL